MWEYLKDLDIFYKYYIMLHNYMTNIDDVPDSTVQSNPNMETIVESHKRYSATFIKILDYFQGNVDYVRLMHEDKCLFKDMMPSIPKHFNGGAKLEYLLSGHNLVTSCFCQMTVERDLKEFDKVGMLENIRKISNAFTVVAANLWKEHEEAYCSSIVKSKENDLKLEKERFARYLNSRGSLVLFIDNKGNVLRANSAAEKHFGIDFSNRNFNIIDILDYHFLSFSVFLSKFNQKELQHLRLMNGEKFLIGVTPLLEHNNVPTEYVLTMKFTERANNLGGGIPLFSCA